MNFDDHTPEEVTEVGSDELLSDDDLRLPEEANPLVRLHAVRAWLTRRQKMANLEIGEAALKLQQLQQDRVGYGQITSPRTTSSPGTDTTTSRGVSTGTTASSNIRGY